MKEKISISDRYYFQEVLPLGCWEPVRPKGKNTLQRLFRHHQKKIDLLVAATAIGLMFLTGIWMFLIELAAVSFHG